jgi:peptidoglycan/xylan/chitin deacetylase (PgdA/CDA1 family)
MTQNPPLGNRSTTERGDRPIAILSYHQVKTPPRRGVPVRTLVLPPWRFALQLQALKTLGWTGLSMRDLEPHLRGEKSGKVFGITLDDGYLNNFQNALPVLRGLGFTATAYIVTGQVGGSNVWDHAKGVPPAPLMDLPQLRGWLDAGMDIGAHTRSHVSLTACSDAVAREEMVGSKHDLERALGIEVRSFSYPYGEHRAEHAEMARQAGFATATTIVSTRARPGDDPLRLPRISIHLENSLPRVVAQVTTGYEDWRQRRLQRGTPLAPASVQPAQPGAAAAATAPLGGGIAAP